MLSTDNTSRSKADELDIEFISDEPLKDQKTDVDAYGYQNLAKRIVRTINKCPTPFRVAIYGSWGAGKSSLLNQLEKELIGQEGEHTVITFNPWIYNANEHIELFFLKDLLSHIRNDDPRYKTVLSFIHNLKEKVLPSIIPSLVKVGIGTKGYLELVAEALDNWLKNPNTDDLISAINSQMESDTFKEEDERSKTFVLIDDLDRCDAQVVVPFINTIKNVFDVYNCVFVFALDKKMISEGIKYHYRSNKVVKPYEYLDKIFDLSLSIDDYRNENSLAEIVKHYCNKANINEVICNTEEIISIFKESKFENPRQIKKYINILALLQNYYKDDWDIEEIKKHQVEIKMRYKSRRDTDKKNKENEQDEIKKDGPRPTFGISQRMLTSRWIDLNEGINEITLLLLVIYFKWNYLFYEVRQNIDLLQQIVKETDKDALIKVLKGYIENEELIQEVFSDSSFVKLQDYLKEHFQRLDWYMAQRQINMLEIL